MDPNELVKQGIAAYRAGQKSEARILLQQAIELDPGSEQAWMWLSGAVETNQERRACLERVLDINPANGTARRGLELLGTEEPPATLAASPPPPSPLPPIKPLSFAEPATPQPPPPAGQPLSFTEPVTPQPPPPPPAASQWAPDPEVPQPFNSSIAPDPVAPLSAEPFQSAAAGQQQVAEKEGGEGSTLFWVAAAGLGLVFICIFGAALYQVLGPGFEFGNAGPTDTPGQITSVLYEQVAAHNAEDIDRYMATMHSKIPGRSQMISTLQDMYATYDLHAALSGVELLEATKKEARVSFVLVTRKIRGPAFADNLIEGVFILRKEDGEWKLYDQEIENTEYLE